MAAKGCYLLESDITWLSTESEAEKQAIIDKVEQIIDKVTGTHWCPTAFDIKLNGNNKNRLFIPLETDILSVTGIFINCVELDSNWWTYDINSVFLDPCIGDSMWGRNAVQDGDFYFWKTTAPTTDLYYWIETPTWEVDFDGGQNEPAIGDDIGTATDNNFFIVGYSVTSGSWAGNDAVGKLWISKPGFTACGWIDNEQINNNTQGNILANGGAGLGVNGPVVDASTINRNAAEVQVGNYCVEMDIDSLNTVAQIRQRVLLLRNRNYRLFFKYMNSKAAKRAKFMLYNADLNVSLLGDGTWVTGQVYVSLPTSGGTATPYVPSWIDYSLDFTSHSDYTGYELYFENENALWEVDFDGAQNKPDIGDSLSTPSGSNFIIDSYVLSSGLWDGTGFGKLWLRKAGATSCGWLDNEDITNDTKSETLAGGVGLGVQGAVATITAADSKIYFDNVGILTAGIAAIASDLTKGIFPHGFNNVQVIGTHGESSIPEAIKQAGIILANWEVDPAAEAAAGLMKSEKIGDYSYTNLATAEADVLTGVNKADMLLRHYIKRKAILMAP